MPNEEPTVSGTAEDQNPHQEVFEESPELKALHEEMVREQEGEEQPQEGEEEVAEEGDGEEAQQEPAGEELEAEGEGEEGSDDDANDYSKRVQTRINKEVKKRHEAEREAERLKARLAELEGTGGDASADDGSQPKGEESANVTPDNAAVEQSRQKVDELKVKIKELRQDLVKAKDEFDHAKEVEILEQIDDIKDQISDERIKVSQLESMKSIAVEDHKKAMQRGSREFAARNKWLREFNEDGTKNDLFDQKRSDLAIMISKEVAVGFNGTPTEYFAEIEKRVKEFFPDPTQKPKYPGAAGVDPVKSSQSMETMQLDDAQKEVAYGAFPELGKRAAEKEYMKIVKNQKRSA
jgi:hypothetical protein